MKENSIEEDIKILEEMIENANIENMDMNDCFGGEHIEAIEHILSDYKRVLKENEELNLKYYMLYTGKIENLKAQEVKIKSQVIPVQKVKDKIEELQKGPLKINENNKYYYETEAYNKIIIQVLQELLEGRK